MSNFSKSLLSKDVIALACGAMIGWSWVLLTGEWILRAGIAGAALAFIVGSLVVMLIGLCLLYTSPSPRDVEESRMPSSA